MKDIPASVRHEGEPVFWFSRLSDLGVLWLINKTVFHPRGFALALSYEDGKDEPIGWTIQGDGSEVWSFDTDVDDVKFEKVEALLSQARTYGRAPHLGPGEVHPVEPENYPER
jgi:hypothetical protein